MQQNIILAVSYPIIGKDSVMLVREVKNDNGVISFVTADSTDRAQRFGGEVGAVVEFLNYHVKPTLENTWKFSFVKDTLITPKEPA